MKTCKVEGCNCKVKGKGYCIKHYTQLRRHGKILDKTRFDKNKIIIHDNYAEIVLLNKDGEECGKALIDLDDIYKVKGYKWCKHHEYVINNSIGGIHRFVMNCPKDMVVDHINHNPLDNRICNLRICSQHENVMNSSLNSNNTSGCTGVAWVKENNRWWAYIQVKGSRINLGYFIDDNEAVKVRKEAEIKYFGEYRNKH